MFNFVSALQGKVHAGEVTVRELGLRGMITLRGDLADKKLRSVCKDITGVAFPAQNSANVVSKMGLIWMSPDEVLLFLPHDAVESALAKIAKALKGRHYLAAEVSDARAVIKVEGAFAHEVLAKLAPVDLDPDRMAVGQFRRSRLGQVAAAFWRQEADTFYVICFRSVAHYAFDLLAASADAGPVGHLAPIK